MEFYYYDASSKLEISDGSRTTTIKLPKNLDPTDVAWAINSATMREIIGQLLTKGEITK